MRDFSFPMLNGKKIAVIGNGRVDAQDAEKIAGCDTITRFNDWSVRLPINGDNRKYGGSRANIVFSNGDSHAHVYGKSCLWPENIVFIRNTKGLPQFITKFYPNEQHRLSLLSYSLLHEAQSAIGHSWCTCGMVTLYHLSKLALDFYVCGFSWEIEKGNPTYNGHRWDLEREWVKRNLLNRPGWDFSTVAKTALAESSSQ